MALGPDSDLWDYYTNIKKEGLAECNLCRQRLKNNRICNLKQHINKVHMNRPEIDEHFEVNALANTATCRTCKQQLKNRLCNIKLHMRRMHKIEIKLPENNKDYKWLSGSKKERLPSPQPYNEHQIQAVLKVAKRKMAEQVASNEKRPTRSILIKMDKKTIVRSVLGLLIEDGISPHLLSSKHFDAILRLMSITDKQGKEFKITEAEIERFINAMASYIRGNFSNDLNCRLLTIKIANDLGAMPNVFCISAAFVNDGEIQNRILGLLELKNNAQLQENDIKQILHKFNIDSNQIIGVFWDNTKSKYESQVLNSEYLKEIENFTLYPELHFRDVKIEPYLGSLAQMCLLNTFKNSHILEHLLECRSLVNFLNDKTHGFFALFESNKAILPQLDSPWNAGSTYKMMNNLLEARNFLQAVKFVNPQEAIDTFNCNDTLWSFIEAFCKSTNYLQKTILKFYNEELHIGDFYAQWLKCKLLTEKFSAASKTSTNEFFSLILTEILKNIDNMTRDLLENERVTGCLYLDPRFQRLLNADQKTIAIEYLKNLWYRSNLYIDDDTLLKNEPAELSEDAFLNEFLTHDLHVKDITSSCYIVKKIEQLQLAFQTADTNILSFWKALKINDPELYILSTICFAIPATEIYTKTRYSHVHRGNDVLEMSTFTKENFLWLRLNAHLFDESLANAQLINDEESIYSLSSSDDELDSYEATEDENSNAASTLTIASGEASKFSNVVVKPSFIDVEGEGFI